MYISELKRNARESLKGRVLQAATATLVFILLSCFVPSIIEYILQNCFGETIGSLFGFIISIIACAALSVGFIRYFISFSNREETTSIELLFSGFDSFHKVFAFELLVSILISIIVCASICLNITIAIVTNANPFVLFMLFIFNIALYVAIIYLCLRLSFVIFIFAEDSESKFFASIKKSLFLTDGYTWKLFLTGLSFILWAFLCILIIPILYVTPYIQLTYLNFYQEVKK